MKPMTKAEAVMAIVDADRMESRAVGRVAAVYKRLLRALDTLGLDAAERNEVLYRIEYHQDREGTQWPWLERAMGKK